MNLLVETDTAIETSGRHTKRGGQIVWCKRDQIWMVKLSS